MSAPTPFLYYFFLTSFLRTCSSPTKIPLPCITERKRESVCVPITTERTSRGTATCIVRFWHAPRPDLRCDLTEALLVDPGEGDGVRGRGGGCDVGREVDEDGVREPEFEVESLGRLRTGGAASGRRSNVFDGCAVADAGEPDGESVALGDADDGVGEEGAGETPHGALVLYGWVLDVDDKVMQTRRLSLYALLLLLLLREPDERSQLDGELPLWSLDDCLSRRGCGQRRELDCDCARHGNGG